MWNGYIKYIPKNTIFSNNININDDINNIIEQIVPWFTPDISFTINTMGDDLNYKDDVFIILNLMIVLR